MFFNYVRTDAKLSVLVIGNENLKILASARL